MSDVQQSRFGRSIQRMFGLKSPHTLVTALPDIFCTTSLDSPPQEFAIFQGVDYCCGRGEIQAAAGQQGMVSLRANVGTGRIVLVDAVTVMSATTQNILIGFEALNGVVSTGIKGFLDSRRVQQFPSSDITQLSAVGSPAANAFVTVRLLANTPFRLPLKVTMTQALNSATAMNLTAMTTTAASNLFATFEWRERVAAPEELLEAF